MALADREGPVSTARVVAQWTYDAYGAVLSAEYIHPTEALHCGHKALFADRLDAGVMQSDGSEPPRLIPFAHLSVHNRNRTYHPALGRFMQRDPNATAMLLMEASAYHGRGMGALAAAFSMEGMYGDGMNLYQYLGSNPWTRWDPLGLESDPFDIVDDYLATWAGNAAATLSALGQDLKAVAVVAATIASYLPFPVVGNLGDIALYALGEQSGAETAVAIGLGLISGGKLLGKAGVLLGKAGQFLGRFTAQIGAATWRGAKHYAGKAIGFLRRGALTLLDHAKGFLRRKPGNACGCFAAGMLVWTAAGQIPIQDVNVGDLVLARDEATGQSVWRQVTAEIVTKHAALLEIVLLPESGKAKKIQTTDEHPFWVNGLGWRRADGLAPGDLVETMAGLVVVQSLQFTNRRTTVFNLSVQGDPNYFVGSDGVWVHNCSKFTRPRNFKLAGKNHPVTGVAFDSMGYPDFGPWTFVTVRLPGGHVGRTKDSKEANKLAGFTKTPEGYTWHHHQDNTTMQLVVERIHTKTGHTGSKPGP